jgi:hypothetical protein
MPDEMSRIFPVSIEDRQRIGEQSEQIVISARMGGMADVAMIVTDDEQPTLGQEAAELVGPERRVCPGAGDQ